MMHQHDIILHAVKERGRGLLREAFWSEGECVVSLS